MKVVKVDKLKGTARDVKCPRGGFNSLRILLEKDGMGYTLTKTTIPVAGKQHWQYFNHLESCYCIQGSGILTNADTGETFIIEPDTCYILDEHDDHYFEAIEEVVLICVFNPPLKGAEVHDESGSYQK
jgi:L-ectoine synthase